MGAESCQACPRLANKPSVVRLTVPRVTLLRPNPLARMTQHKTQGFVAALCLAPLLLSAVPASSRPQKGEVWTQTELEAQSAAIQLEVEAIREEKFKRPVAVKLIDGAGFVEYAKKRMAEMTTPEQVSAEEDMFKMLGLVDADVDMVQATMDLLEGQVGGFYDPASDTFYLMESFTGGIAKVILAHELTHALDDQLFDHDGGFEERLKNRDALSAYQAVVEGSGTAIMTVWTMQNIGALSPDDLEQVQSMGTESLASAPPVLWKPLLGAYITGQTFLQKGYRRMKKADKSATLAEATTIAFESPPRSTEQVLHPDKYWVETELDEPIQVRVALEAPEGWEVLERSVLGELHLSLITEEPKEIDFTNQMEMAFMKFTNAGAEGWGGDEAGLFGKGDARRLVVTTAWDTENDAQEFEDAMHERLENWRKKVALLDPDGLGSGVEITPRGDTSLVTLDIWYGSARE